MLTKSSKGPRPLDGDAVRVLGAAGLLSAVLSSSAGFFALPFLLGVAGVIMTLANLYALATGAGQETPALQEAAGADTQPAAGGV